MVLTLFVPLPTSAIGFHIDELVTDIHSSTVTTEWSPLYYDCVVNVMEVLLKPTLRRASMPAIRELLPNGTRVSEVLSKRVNQLSI